MLVIGDVHTKIEMYYEILKKHNFQKSIQVGDFGFKRAHQWHLDNLTDDHKVNFGNHDDYNFLNEKYSCGNFSFSNDIMTIRGANSIDRYNRIENTDWFSNEELNYNEMGLCIDSYIENKPKIVISHDCPDEICKSLFGIYDKSITRKGLQSMFEIHKPDLWIFGHHHESKNVNILGTQFVCLNELETYLI